MNLLSTTSVCHRGSLSGTVSNKSVNLSWNSSEKNTLGPVTRSSLSWRDSRRIRLLRSGSVWISAHVLAFAPSRKSTMFMARLIVVFIWSWFSVPRFRSINGANQQLSRLGPSSHKPLPPICKTLSISSLWWDLVSRQRQDQK